MRRQGQGGGKTRPRQDPRMEKRPPNLGMPIGGGGRPIVDPGFNRGLPGSPDMNGAERGLGLGIGLAKGMGGRYAGPQRGGMPQPPQTDYFAQFNSWTDPNIGGEQPGELQRGWGGIGQGQTLGGPQGSGSGTMMATKLNGWLNTFTDPVERMKAMNGIGYNNGGNPYTPQVPRGTNQWYRGNARENQQTGGYSAPGIYEHQTAGASADNIANFGGYTGYTNVGDDGSAQYTPFDINAKGRTRRTRTFGQVAY